MSNVDVNIISVLISAILCLMFNAAWYGFLFGKTWLALMHLSGRSIIDRKRHYITTIIFSIVTCFGIALFLSLGEARSIANTMILVFWLWFAFVLPSNLMSVLWSGKDKELFLIDIGNYFFSMQIAGVVITLIG